MNKFDFQNRSINVMKTRGLEQTHLNFYCLFFGEAQQHRSIFFFAAFLMVNSCVLDDSKISTTINLVFTKRNTYFLFYFLIPHRILRMFHVCPKPDLVYLKHMLNSP